MLGKLNEVRVGDGVPLGHDRVPSSGQPSDDNQRGGDSAILAIDTVKAEVKRALPKWCAERQRLNLDRIHHRDTTGGETLVVGFARLAGVPVAVGLGAVIGWLVYSSSGLGAGIAAGLVGLAIALFVAFAGVAATRKRFDRKEHERQAIVARLESAIRDLDKRIARAFIDHQLIGHAPTHRVR